MSKQNIPVDVKCSHCNNMPYFVEHAETKTCFHACSKCFARSPIATAEEQSVKNWNAIMSGELKGQKV